MNKEKALFEAYRSREIIWVKPKINARGEQFFYTKDGKSIPTETIRQKYEKIETEEKTL